VHITATDSRTAAVRGVELLAEVPHQQHAPADCDLVRERNHRVQAAEVVAQLRLAARARLARTLLKHRARLGRVALRVVQHDVGGAAVAARAAGFLVVACTTGTCSELCPLRSRGRAKAAAPATSLLVIACMEHWWNC
jgi:hypothetical protein